MPSFAGGHVGQSVRFIHTADLHLDAPFKNVRSPAEHVRDALSRCTVDALEAVARECIERKVDFLVIAGDLFDDGDAGFRAQSRFKEQAERLGDAGIRIYWARGNHDPADSKRRVELPENVHVFSHEDVERVEWRSTDGARSCVLWGMSYPTRVVKDNLALRYAEAIRRDGDAPAVAVLHANVGGPQEEEPYAPCKKEDLRRADVDYWALGHIHKRQEVLKDFAWYPGSPQGLDPSETGLHGCLLVELDGSKAHVEPVHTCSVVWESLEVDLEGCESESDVERRVGEAIDGIQSGADGRPVMARVRLIGVTPVHEELAREGSQAQVLAEVSERLLGGSPWASVEFVGFDTKPPLDLEVIRKSKGFDGELARMVDELLADPQAARELVEAATQELSEKLRKHKIRHLLEEDGWLEDDDLQRLLEAARDEVLCLLQAGDEE